MKKVATSPVIFQFLCIYYLRFYKPLPFNRLPGINQYLPVLNKNRENIQCPGRRGAEDVSQFIKRGRMAGTDEFSGGGIPTDGTAQVAALQRDRQKAAVFQTANIQAAGPEGGY